MIASHTRPLARALALTCLALGCSSPASSQAPSAEGPCPGLPDGPLASGRHEGLSVAGSSRAFELRVPEDAEGPLPLVVALHGTTENGARFLRRARLDTPPRPMIVVAPDAAGHGEIWPVWDALRLGDAATPNPDLALFDALLACAQDRLEVDPERIFVVGHSAGGAMANRVLRSRSDRVAGGIVGSGVFELTGSADAPLSPMKVIVTWGGDNDVYTGQTRNGTGIARFPFPEQAVLAARFYAEQPAVQGIHCEGDGLGHAWLSPLNTQMFDALFEEDKPLEGASGVARCSTTPPPAPTLADTPACPGEGSCPTLCAAASRCLVGNQTVGPILSPQLTRLGLTSSSCAGCVSACGATRDDPAVACMTAEALPPCGPGLQGALPLVQRIDRCCAAHPDSPLCAGLCTGIGPRDAAAAFLPACATTVRSPR